MLKLLTLVVATATTLVAGQTYIVGFDDLDAVKQRTNYEVDTRNGLFYVNFYYQDPRNGTKVPYGLIPTSKNNVGLYYTSANQGSIPNALPSISSYGSNIANFDLTSFNFGCVSARDGVAYGLSRCNVAIFGYRNNARVASQSFSYLPTSRQPTGSFVEASLNSDFQNLEKVRFVTDYAPSLVPPAQTGDYRGATWFDDIQLTVHPRTTTVAP